MPQNEEVQPKREQESLQEKKARWAQLVAEIVELRNQATRELELLTVPVLAQSKDILPFEEIERQFSELISIGDIEDEVLFVQQCVAARRQYYLWAEQKGEERAQIESMYSTADESTARDIEEAIIQFDRDFVALVDRVITPAMRTLTDREHELIHHRTEEIIKTLQPKLEQLMEELESNEELLLSLREGFIVDVMHPRIARSVSRGNHTQEQGEGLLKRILEKERERAKGQAVDDNSYSPADDEEMIAVGEDEYFLQHNRPDRTVIEELMTDFKNTQYSAIRKMVEAQVSIVDWIEMVGRLDVTSTDCLEKWVVVREDGFPSTNERHIQVWQSLLNNQVFSEVFGDFLNEEDQKIRSSFVTQTEEFELTDALVGNAYYPTIEGVRNLILNYAQYERLGRNHPMKDIDAVLTKIMNRSDWNEIKQQVEQKYPDIFTFKENGGVYIARKVIEVDRKTGERSKLAYANFNTAELFQIFCEEQGNAQQYPNLLQVLEEFPTKNPQMAERKSMFSREQSWFETYFREAILFLYEIYTTSRYQEDFNRWTIQKNLIYFEKVAEKILKFFSQKESDDESQKVTRGEFDFFSSKELTQFLLTSEYKSKIDFLIHRAIQICPSLSDDRIRTILIGADTDFYISEKSLANAQKLIEIYGDNQKIMERLLGRVGAKDLNIEVALSMKSIVPVLFEEQWSNILDYLINQAWEHLTSVQDLEFINTLIGYHGIQAASLIREYFEGLENNTFTKADNQNILELTKQFRVISPEIYRAFIEAKRSGTSEIFFNQLKGLAEKMSSQTSVTDAERALPYFKDVVKYVFPNNSNQWTSYENNNSCSDRSKDLAAYTVRPKYEMDLLEASEMRLKTDEQGNQMQPDEEKLKVLQQPVYAVAERGKILGFDKKLMQEALARQIQEMVLKADPEKKRSDFHQKDMTNGQQLYLLFSEAVYGDLKIDIAELKEMFLLFLFTEYEDVQAYIAGTNQRVDLAKNREYALLSELHTFFSDRIKEAFRDMTEAAYNSSSLKDSMQAYFRNYVQLGQRQRIARFQVDKLGMSEGFLNQIARTLNKGRKRKYSLNQVAEIIRRYELLKSASEESGDMLLRKERTKGFFGQLETQLKRTQQAVREITGEEMKESALWQTGEVIDQLLAFRETVNEQQYDESQFASFTVRRILNLFNDELDTIEAEINKFESPTGAGAKKLNGYMVKNKESAHARMVGGVCVSGDNPAKNTEQNQWEMPNYLQFVLQDSENFRCQGADLLHVEQEGDLKVLCVSFNPSSTYLYQVDEKTLFNSLLQKHIEFATDNNFDLIVVSKNQQIRTNRTGGQFEAALNEKIAEVNESFDFSTTRVFSYNPSYQMKQMDILWKKSQTEQTSQ